MHKSHILNKLKKPMHLFKPEILQRVLLTVQESPLNKAGYVKTFVRTAEGTLLSIEANCKIPRIAKKFHSLMNQLLTKLRIRAVNTSNTLLTVIKNPIENHLPADCPKIGVSQSEKGNKVKVWEYVPKLEKNETTVFFIDVGS
jgi:rRNA small subunit pseudouridine methyltransferase Nep1